MRHDIRKWFWALNYGFSLFALNFYLIRANFINLKLCAKRYTLHAGFIH